MFSSAMKSWSESQCNCNKVIKNSSVKMQILCTFRCCTLSYLFFHWNDINIFSWHHSIFLFPDWRQSSIRRSSHCPWAPLNQLSLLRKLSCSNNLLNGKWTIFFSNIHLIHWHLFTSKVSSTVEFKYTNRKIPKAFFWNGQKLYTYR